MLKRLLTADEFSGLNANDRDHYTPQSDGTYIVDIEGVVTEDQISNLKSALDKERRTVRELTAKVRELTTTWDGYDPATVAEWRTTVENLADKTIIDSEGLEAARQKWITGITDVHKREQAEWQKKLQDADAARESAIARWKQDRLDAKLMAAGQKYGVDGRSVQDLLLRGRSEARIDDNGREFFPDENNEPQPGPDGIQNMTVEDWIVARKQDTNWFGVSSGGGAHHRDGMSTTSQPPAGLSPAQRLTFARQQQSRRSA